MTRFFTDNIFVHDFSSEISWKFSKVETSLTNQISCLKFVSNKLDQIIKSDSPVALLLELPGLIENHQQRIGMPIAANLTDGEFGSRATHIFVDLYNVCLY